MTKRLVIRSYETADSQQLFQLVNRNKNHISSSMPLTIQANATLNDSYNSIEARTKELYDGITFVCGIFQTGSNKLIGQLAILNIDWRVPKCELAYFIDEIEQGKGFTSEAIEAIIKHAFEKLQMNKIFVRINASNISSLRVAQKCGFKKNGLMRNDFKTSEGKILDLEYWDLLPSAFGN